MWKRILKPLQWFSALQAAWKIIGILSANAGAIGGLLGGLDMIVYPLAITFFTLTTIYYAWEWYDPHRPTSKFKKLYPAIEKAHQLYWEGREYGSVAEYSIAVGKVRGLLRPLKIGLPGRHDEEVEKVLSDLLGYSKEGKLEEAQERTKHLL